MISQLENSVEQQLLLKLVSPNVNEDIIEQYLTYCAQVNWTQIVQLAIQHGVIGLICQRLIEYQFKNIPNEILNAAITHQNTLFKKNSKRYQQLIKILITLEEHNISAIPFKGPMLAIIAYGNVKYRNFSDLDFLIHQSDRADALRILHQIGFQRESKLSPRQKLAYWDTNGQDILFNKSGDAIEPHWEFIPSTFAFQLDYKGIWQRAKLVTFENDKVWGFCDEDYFLILCLHGCKEEWIKLKWISDLAHFIKNTHLNWDKVHQLALQQNLVNIVSLSLMVLKAVINYFPPEQVLLKFNHKQSLVQLAEGVKKSLFKPDRESSVNHLRIFHWKMRDSLTEKLHYAINILTNPRPAHFQSIELPDKLFWLYIPFKILHDYCLLPLWLLFKWARKQLRIKV